MQKLSYVITLRSYIGAARGVFRKGAGLHELRGEAAGLAVHLGLTTLLFRKQVR